jgi:transposase
VIKIICGVDVSKARLDACIETGSIRGRFKNDEAGIASLAEFCRLHRVELVAMEATGGYERWAFLLLYEHGLPCAVTNARHVRLYAEAMGVLEKTDEIDARIIARFARAKDLQPLPNTAQLRLKALVARLRQVTDDLTVQKQRRSNLLDNPEILASVDEVIALLKRQSRTLEGEIGSMIDDDPLWALLAESWSSVKGVASRTVARLMADLPEIGTCSNKADRQQQRQEAGQTAGSGWTQQRAFDPVPRRRNRLALRSKLGRLPRQVGHRWKRKNGHPYCACTQTSRSPQRKSTRCACRIRQCNLTLQIVAHPARTSSAPPSPHGRGDPNSSARYCILNQP